VFVEDRPEHPCEDEGGKDHGGGMKPWTGEGCRTEEALLFPDHDG